MCAEVLDWPVLPRQRNEYSPASIRGKCTNGLRSTTRGMVAQRFSPALELMAADCRFVRISLPLRASSYWRLQGTLVGVQVLEDAADRKSGPFICVKPVLILQCFHLP
jgi:hypothetical protein